MKLYLSPMRDFKDLSGLERLWPQRREKVLKYSNAADRARCLAGGLMLLHVLGICRDSQISFNRYGKPFLPEPALHFNLSHSGDYVVLAVDENEVGVDIEKIAPYSDEIARKCFSAEEYRWLQGRAEDRAFYALWTAKESVMKACGKGLEMAPESFSVFPVSDGPRRINGKIWFLSRHFYDGHQICIASEKAISQTDIFYLSKSDLLTPAGDE